MRSGFLMVWVVEMLPSAGNRFSARSEKPAGASRAWAAKVCSSRAMATQAARISAGRRRSAAAMARARDWFTFLGFCTDETLLEGICPDDGPERLKFGLASVAVKHLWTRERSFDRTMARIWWRGPATPRPRRPLRS